jgi:hypothetical protein
MGTPHAWPRLRWVALAWLVVYLPAYTMAYGVANFLFLCNVGVLLTALALVAGNQLRLSSQAVAAPVIGLAWAIDAGWRVTTGQFLYGGTSYMWDPQYPLFTRLLSLYHVVWPLVVLFCVARRGYDRRGWALQVLIAAAAIGVARLATAPDENVNFAFRDPFWNRQLGPAALHLTLVLAALGGVAYGLTHLLLRTSFAPARAER